MITPKLEPPTYKIISSYAAAVNPENSLTIIDLGTLTTIKPIKKDEIIATGTINSISIEYKSLQD